MSAPHDLSISEAAALLRRRELSAEELTRGALARIAATEPALHSFITVTEDVALAAARDADRRLRDGDGAHALTGIPVAIKDVIATAGVRTTAGSRILERFVPPYDATVSARLKAAGAVLVGKANCDEFAMGSSTENSAYGPTRNPWDLGRVPGGSSGGSATAVAAGQACASLGTDTGGSIRLPASYCGVVGMKPTYGRVSRYGVVAYASSLDQVGPFTRTVADCALVLGVIAGHDPRDSTSAARPVPDYSAALATGASGLRVAIPREYFVEGMQPEVEQAVRAAVSTLAGLGATVEDATLPHTEYAVSAYYVVATAEASSNLARYDGIRYGTRVAADGSLLGMYRRTRAAGFGAEVKRRIMLGTYALSAGYYDAYYLKAEKVRTLIRRDFARVFENADVIVTPVAPTTAFRLGEKLDDPLQMYLSDIFTISVNLAGLPAIVVPCGVDGDGMPIGLQIVGPPFGEEAVLRAAHAYEQATDWHRRRPPELSGGWPVSERDASGATGTGRFEAVIGLEVHAEMLTESKIFCACSARFGASPNEHTCPVCLGMPGVLPALNRRVVEFAIRAGLATGCTIAPRSRWARKNYFYPDLPKGYQISQYELPICIGGHVDIVTDAGARRVRLTRIHMEEDTGKNIHDAHGDASLVDFNRSGVPLLEIVSEPDMSNPAEAGAYLRNLRTLLQYLRICDGNMEEGSFRCDANVSVRPRGTTALGVKAEVKNMNSFRAVEKAIAYEIARHVRVLEDGGTITQETRLWDADREETRSMRSKEFAHDYRYFPDPDLPPVIIDAATIEAVRGALPELPDARRTRFVETLGLPAYDAEVLTSRRDLADYFEDVVRAHPNAKAASNWVMGDVLRLVHERKLDAAVTITEWPVTAAHLGALIALIDGGAISGKIAKTVFEEMVAGGQAPGTIVAEKGLTQVSDEGAIAAAIEQVMAANADKVAEFRAGKDKLLGFFVGQVMKATGGKANPPLVNRLLVEKLKG